MEIWKNWARTLFPGPSKDYFIEKLWAHQWACPDHRRLQEFEGMQGWGFRSGSRLLSLCFTTKPADWNLPQVRTFVRVRQKRLHPRSAKFGGHTAHVEWGVCQDRGTWAMMLGWKKGIPQITLLLPCERVLAAP